MKQRQMIGLDGKPILNEVLIRQWVRDEHNQIQLEKQATCSHSKSGTVIAGGDVKCDACGKILDIEEDGNMESIGAEFKQMGKVL